MGKSVSKVNVPVRAGGCGYTCPPLRGAALFDEITLADREYDRLYTLAVRVGRAVLLSKPDAEDVAQDILVSLWLRSQSNSINPIENRTKWVTKSVCYAAVKVLRRRRLELPLHCAVRTVDDTIDQGLDLATALHSLSASEQHLVALRFWNRMQVQRIAETLKISDRTVRRRLKHAMAVLKRSLDPLHDQSPTSTKA